MEVIPPGLLHHRRSRLKATPPTEPFICPISGVSIPHLGQRLTPGCQPNSLSASSVVRIGSIQLTISSMTEGSSSRSMPRNSHALKLSGHWHVAPRAAPAAAQGSFACRGSWFRRVCLECSPPLVAIKNPALRRGKCSVGRWMATHHVPCFS